VAELKPKILIIEDDLDVADMLNAYFLVQGYEVFTVNWGEDGVRACQTVHPDLVILDIRLPDIDGYEVARRLRGDRRPFDIQELRLRVRNALRRMTQGSLTNPVSSLPEGALVDERLGEVLQKGGWAVLLVSLENIDAFRELYGFVASDDVLRAVSLMILNTMRELSSPDDFLGHVSATDFVLVVSPVNLPILLERLRTRLEQSLDYFYPIKDREQASKRKDRLAIKLADLSSITGRFETAEQLKKELLSIKK
jgi:CheY-like chemotaxis protein